MKGLFAKVDNGNEHRKSRVKRMLKERNEEIGAIMAKKKKKEEKVAKAFASARKKRIRQK